MKKHLIRVALIAAALAAVLVYLSLRYDLVPFPYSAERESIDSFIKVLFAIASVFFSVILVVFTYSLIVFRRRPGEPADGRPFTGYAPLELTWTIVPLVIVLVLAAFGGVLLNNMTRAGPAGTEMEVDVTAQRFSWQFYYPGYNVTSYQLHVPVNQRLLVRLESKDVVHSFWVQEWGPKQDAVPGITTEVRYTPNRIGQYLVQCSQLCGFGHTYMTAPAFVTSLSDFQSWVQQNQAPVASPVPTPATAQYTFTLIAKNISFNLNSITVPPGATVTINLDNQDKGIPHNLSVYLDSAYSKALFSGQIVTGPGKVQYSFIAPSLPGSYPFRCDVHPTIMTGTLVVK
jgi:cytochrome c oxidase subunit II